MSILESINKYRECVRSIWNIYFLNNFQINQDWILIDSFNRIKQDLFQSIVLYQLEEDMPDFVLGYPINKIKIIPADNICWEIPVSINREKGINSGYWDHPITKINSYADISFINFFDWNPYGFIDMSKIIAVISDYPENQNLIGHCLIIDLIYVDIVIHKMH